MTAVAHRPDVGRLARYVRAHGFDAYTRDGRLFVRPVFAYVDSLDVREGWRELPATPRGVRDWLGY